MKCKVTISSLLPDKRRTCAHVSSLLQALIVFVVHVDSQPFINRNKEHALFCKTDNTNLDFQHILLISFLLLLALFNAFVFSLAEALSLIALPASICGQ